MKIYSSPELLAFYKSWLAWAENGAPDGAPHWRDDGLCLLALASSGLRNELEWQFYEAGLDYTYPFGQVDYCQRSKAKTQHLCPKRLAWVRARIADSTDTQEG